MLLEIDAFDNVAWAPVNSSSNNSHSQFENMFIAVPRVANSPAASRSFEDGMLSWSYSVTRFEYISALFVGKKDRTKMHTTA
jgi:hypothetical protein